MADTPIAHCSSCQAEIIWVIHTTTGKRMPIDAHPVANGNLRLHPRRSSQFDELGNFVPGRVATVEHAEATGTLFDPTDDGERYQSHFASCPQASFWRGQQPRPADTPGPQLHIAHR